MGMRTAAAVAVVVPVLCSDLFLIISSGCVDNGAASETEAAFQIGHHDSSRDVLLIPPSRFSSMRAHKAQERHLKTIDSKLRLKIKTRRGIVAAVIALAVLISVCFYMLPNLGDAFKKRESGRLLGAGRSPLLCPDSDSDADGPEGTDTTEQNQRSSGLFLVQRQTGDEGKNVAGRGLVEQEHSYSLQPDGERNNTAGGLSTAQEHAYSPQPDSELSGAASHWSVDLEHSHALQPDDGNNQTNTGDGLNQRPYEYPSSSAAPAPSARPDMSAYTYSGPTFSSALHSRGPNKFKGAFLGPGRQPPKNPPCARAGQKRVYESAAHSTSSDYDTDSGNRSSEADNEGEPSAKIMIKRSSSSACLAEASGEELQESDRSALFAASASVTHTQLDFADSSSTGKSAHVGESVVALSAFEQPSTSSSFVSGAGPSDLGAAVFNLNDDPSNFGASQSDAVPDSAPGQSSEADSDCPRKRLQKTKHIHDAPSKVPREDTATLGEPSGVLFPEESPKHPSLYCSESDLSGSESRNDSESGEEWSEDSSDSQSSKRTEDSASAISIYDGRNSTDGTSASHQDLRGNARSSGSGSAETEVLFSSVDRPSIASASGSMTRTTLNFYTVLLHCGVDAADQVLQEIRVIVPFSPTTNQLRHLFKWYLSISRFLSLRLKTAKTILRLATGRPELEEAVIKLRRTVESIDAFVESQPLHLLVLQTMSEPSSSNGNSQNSGTAGPPRSRIFLRCESSVRRPDTGEVAAGPSRQEMGSDASQPEASTSGNSSSGRIYQRKPVVWPDITRFRPNSLHLRAVTCYVRAKILAHLHYEDLDIVSNPSPRHKGRLEALMRQAMSAASLSANVFDQARYEKSSRFLLKYMLMAESSAYSIFLNLRHSVETIRAIEQQEQQLQQQELVHLVEQQLQQQQYQLQQESDQGPQGEAQPEQQQQQQQQQETLQGLFLEDLASQQRRDFLLISSHLRQAVGFVGALITSVSSRSLVARMEIQRHLTRLYSFVETGHTFISVYRVRGALRALLMDALYVSSLIVEEGFAWLRRLEENNE